MPRTTAITLGFVLVAAVSTPAQQAAPPVVARESAAFIVFTVKAGKTADFEAAWSAIRAGLARATSAEARAFRETLKVYRADTGQPIALQPTPEYTLLIDDPSRALSYNPARIVNEMLLGAGLLTPEEADGIIRKLKEALMRIQVRPMVKIG